LCDEIDSEFIDKEGILNYVNKFIDALAHFNDQQDTIEGFSRSLGIRYFNELMLFNRKPDNSKMLGKILFNENSNNNSYKDLFLSSIIKDTIDYELHDFLGMNFSDIMQMEFGDYNVLKNIVIEKRKKLKELSESISGDSTKKQINDLEKSLSNIKKK